MIRGVALREGGKPNRVSSCPPRRARSLVSSPWSSEWLHDHVHRDTSVISSARKKSNGIGHECGFEDMNQV